MRRKETSGILRDDPRFKRLERLGYFLDASIRIPGIGYRIGYDALIGLVPGFGDAAGLALSSYIVVEAARLGASPGTLLRMVLNVAIEALFGVIPLLGDVFDATFKANMRNLALLEAHVDPGARRVSSNRRYYITILVVLVLILAAILAMAYFLFGALLHLAGLI